jgi:hypothetical protein
MCNLEDISKFLDADKLLRLSYGEIGNLYSSIMNENIGEQQNGSHQRKTQDLITFAEFHQIFYQQILILHKVSQILGEERILFK